MKNLKPFRSYLSPGFTLVELMLTMLIAAILTAISVPSYTYQIRKARRTEARLALYDLATREERFFSTNSAYSSAASDLGYSGTFPLRVGNGYYQVSVCVAAQAPCGEGTAATGGVFLLTATPVGPQASDMQCTSFSLDNTGAQSATGTGAVACWKN
jgi:type IV pilus assembly protein PilE